MTVPHIPRGPVMADIAAFRLTEEEKQRLLDPAVGGVILFRRNFQNIVQLKELTAEIKALRTPGLIIAVDHERRQGSTVYEAYPLARNERLRANLGQRKRICRRNRSPADRLGFGNRAFRLRHRLVLHSCLGFGLGKLSRHRQPQFPP